MYERKLKTPPAAEPLSLAEAKSHLRVSHPDEDDLITALIQAAREHAEAVTCRALITQTWELSLDCFLNVVDLPFPTLGTVVAITYVDTDGATQTLASTVYVVDTVSTPGRIYQAYDQEWPSTRGQRHAVTIEFTAGFGAAGEDVPATIRQAMKLIIGHLYNNREEVVTGTIATQLPMAVAALLAPHIIPEAA